MITERVGGVARLTIDHAERHNALSESVRDALMAAFAIADADDDVRCIVLTGGGSKAFASGADIRELASRALNDQRRVMTNGGVFGAARRVRKPVVAAINGLCLGGGLELAIACDIRIAARHARFGQPEVALGLIPGGGATQMLPRLIGMSAALRLVLTGEAIDADEALRIGLIHEVVDEGSLQDRAMEVGTVIASRAPLALQAAKRATREALDRPLEEGRELEAALFEQCFSSADRTEGVEAFLGKRPPRFTGH